MWNIAVIDNKQYLFDPTWGAGRYNGGFIKDPSYFFYKTPPSLFIKTHFPAQYEDALMPNTISRDQFAAWPLIIDKKLTMDALSIQKKGTISSENLLGEIPFAITLGKEVEVSYAYSGERVIVESEIMDGMVTFSIPIELGETQLLLYFNGKPAIAYKIK